MSRFTALQIDDDDEVDNAAGDEKTYEYTKVYKTGYSDNDKKACLSYGSVDVDVLLKKFKSYDETVAAANIFFRVGPHCNIIAFHDCNSKLSEILVGTSNHLSLTEFLQNPCSRGLFWEKESGGFFGTGNWRLSEYAIEFFKGIFAGVKHIAARNTSLKLDENCILVDGSLDLPIPEIDVSSAKEGGSVSAMFRSIADVMDYLMFKCEISSGHQSKPTEEITSFMTALKKVSTSTLPLVVKLHPAILMKTERLLFLVSLRESLVRKTFTLSQDISIPSDLLRWMPKVRDYGHFKGIYDYEKGGSRIQYNKEIPSLINFIRNFDQHINEYLDKVKVGKIKLSPTDLLAPMAPIPRSSNDPYSSSDIEANFQTLFPSLLLHVHKRLEEEKLAELEGVDKMGIQ